uniref:Uncharacterized protein n=1 Tax=Globodera rostochiensis TaxID=31243 RepID=A0A914I6W5_GLORO
MIEWGMDGQKVFGEPLAPIASALKNCRNKKWYNSSKNNGKENETEHPLDSMAIETNFDRLLHSTAIFGHNGKNGRDDHDDDELRKYLSTD